MMKVTNLVKSALIALLATTAASANATVFSGSYNFDNVSSGATANSALGAATSFMTFANVDRVDDLVGTGFHWEDFSSTLGDVLALSDANAVSGSNVLWNSSQPMALFFTSDSENIASFSLQLAGPNFNTAMGGANISFLDATHHVIAGADLFADSNGFITLTSVQNNVAGIFISAGGNYDNLSIASVAAVPEADTYAMFLAGLGLMSFVARRRNKITN
jgi:PEP-CTERM motif